MELKNFIELDALVGDEWFPIECIDIAIEFVDSMPTLKA